MILTHEPGAAHVPTADFRISHSRAAVTEAASFRHLHDAFELILYVKADLKVFVRDQPYEVTGGELVLIGEHEIHRMEYRPTPDYDRYVIYFKRSRVQPVLAALGRSDLLEQLTGRNMPRLHPGRADFLQMRSGMETIEKELAAGSANASTQEDAHARALLALTAILLRVGELLRTAETPTPSGKTSRLVQQIAAYIDANHAEPISLEDLQCRFYADRCHISHAFRQQTGFGVIEYIQFRRVAEAQKMLKSTERSILDICMDCGFNNAQHFYRVFRKISGTTPERYRKGTG